MLQVVESGAQKRKALQRFDVAIRSAWRQREVRRIVWRGGYRDLQIVHNRRFWYVSVKGSREQKIRRVWNAFGLYKARGSLPIAVEINVPTTLNSRKVSGYFAYDPAGGAIYVMHDGAVGGGRKGVGRAAFLMWSTLKTVPTNESDGRIRRGLIAASLDDPNVAVSVASFVARVAAFKEAVSAGRISPVTRKDGTLTTFDDYYCEFSGEKRGQRAREFAYISRHGDIVDALTRWRPADVERGERLVKSILVDLAIRTASRLTVLYEVKTSADRQNLYAAIGQLLVHGGQRRGVQRYIVVPQGAAVPTDVSSALTALRIGVLRFSLGGEQVAILLEERGQATPSSPASGRRMPQRALGRRSDPLFSVSGE